MSTLTIVFMCLYAVCEVLAAIPGIKSNSVFQLLLNVFKYLAGTGSPPPTPPPPPPTPMEMQINAGKGTAKERQEAEETGRPS